MLHGPIRQSLPSSAIQDLVDVGIDAIALDTTPGGLLPPARVQHYRQDLSLELGAPIDMGSALVWWISTDQPPPPPMHNAQEWRSTMDRKLQAAPRLKYRSLLRPVPMEPQQ